MAYCSNCGVELDKKVVICPSCGVSQQVNNDSGAIGYGILGFLCPIVGFIFFVLWYDTKPKTAKGAAIGGLIWVALWTIFCIFVGVFNAMGI